MERAHHVSGRTGYEMTSARTGPGKLAEPVGRPSLPHSPLQKAAEPSQAASGERSALRGFTPSPASGWGVLPG